jgi:hypothetical protein
MFFRTKTMSNPSDSGESAALPRGTGAAKRIVADLVNDRHGLSALEAYADACEAEMPWLSAQLRSSLALDPARATRCGKTALRVFSLARAWAQTQPDFSGLAWEHVQIGLETAIRSSFAQQRQCETNEWKKAD